MTLFADTNWLVAAYFLKQDEERTAVVERFSRRHSLPWVMSHIVILEARNVFAWLAKEVRPPEWSRLQEDCGRRIYVDTMDWDRVRQQTKELVARYSHKAQLGTFDTVLVASALLTGATHFLSFDSKLKALAAVERLTVFPELTGGEKAIVAKLRSTGR
jgi:predicted nucleic acid-binding protein